MSFRVDITFNKTYSSIYKVFSSIVSITDWHVTALPHWYMAYCANIQLSSWYLWPQWTCFVLVSLRHLVSDTNEYCFTLQCAPFCVPGCGWSFRYGNMNFSRESDHFVYLGQVFRELGKQKNLHSNFQVHGAKCGWERIRRPVKGYTCHPADLNYVTLYF